MASQSWKRHGWLIPVLLTMAAAGLSQGFGRLTYAFVLKDMVDGPIGSYTTAGALAAINLLAYLAAVLVMMRWARRFESTRLLAWGVAASTVALGAMAIAPTAAALATALLLMGIGSGITWLACVPVVLAFAPSDRRGLAFGLMTSGIGLSIILIGPIAGLVHHYFGPAAWRQVWGLQAVLGVVILAALVLYLRPIGVLEPPAASTDHEKAPRIPVTLVWLTVSYGLFGVVHATYISFLPAAAQADAGITVAGVAQMFTLLGLCHIIGGLILGRASDTFGRRVILIASLLAMCGCALAIANGDEFGVFSSAALYGLLMSGFSTVIIAYLGDIMAPDRVVSSYGLVTVAVGIGQAAGPPIGGLLADRTGNFSSTYVLVAVTALFAALAATQLRSKAAGGGPMPQLFADHLRD